MRHSGHAGNVPAGHEDAGRDGSWHGSRWAGCDLFDNRARLRRRRLMRTSRCPKTEAPAGPGPTHEPVARGSPRWASRGEQACRYGCCVKPYTGTVGLLLLGAPGLAGAGRLGHHGLFRGALASRLLGGALACRLLRGLLRRLAAGLARGLARGRGFRLRRFAGGGFAGRLLGGFLFCSFLGSHRSSQLLISWQWLPSKRMQKRLAQKIAVRGVPQAGHLTTCALVGKQPKYMRRNRYGDFPNLLGLVTVLDVRLDVLGSRHASVLRHVVVRKASLMQSWCQSIFCGE